MSPTPQMDVLYLHEFGHVLGILTRASEPEQIETDVSGFVGDGLHMRSSPPFAVPAPFTNNPDFVIPADHIGLYQTARDWRQLFSPFSLFVNLRVSTTAPETPVAVLPYPSGANAPSASIVTAPNLTVTVTNAVTSPTAILVIVQDSNGGSPVAIAGYQIPMGQTSVDVPVNGLNTGDNYNALLFVPLLPIGVASFTAP